MKHSYIEQYNLVDLYLMGKLAAEESARFEEHFIDCPECIDRLNTTKDFLQDLRMVAAQQTSQTDNYRPKGLARYFSQILSPKALALAAGCLLILAIAGMILLINRVGSLQAEVDEAKNVSAQLERRYEEERQTADSSDKKRQEVEQELTEQLRRLEAKIQNEQKQRANMATESGGGMQPGINLPIFVLKTIRTASEPGNEIDLSRARQGFLMSVALEDDINYKDYRMTILDSRNRTIWKRGGYKPNSYNALSIGFNSRYFQPGNYLLRVEGVAKEGNLTRIADYPFRIIH